LRKRRFILARFGGIFLGFFLFLALSASGCSAQVPGSSGALTPEIKRRIQTEIRSRYNVPPSIGVGLSELKASEVPGYDQLTVTFTGGTHNTTFDFLLSKDRKTLARLEKFVISQDLMAKIDVKGRPVRGNPNAQVAIVNFDDFQCPFCSRMHATLFPGILQAYGDKIKVIYKDYPLVEIHPWAMHAAVNANCLAEQSNDAYWDFADYVHGNQKEVSGRSRVLAGVELRTGQRLQYAPGPRFRSGGPLEDLCGRRRTAAAEQVQAAFIELMSVSTVSGYRIRGIL